MISQCISIDGKSPIEISKNINYIRVREKRLNVIETFQVWGFLLFISSTNNGNRFPSTGLSFKRFFFYFIFSRLLGSTPKKGLKVISLVLRMSQMTCGLTMNESYFLLVEQEFLTAFENWRSEIAWWLKSMWESWALLTRNWIKRLKILSFSLSMKETTGSVFASILPTVSKKHFQWS